MNGIFRRFSRAASSMVGSPGAFLLGVVLTLLWAGSGPYFHYSDTWQLVINTGTSIGTFLIVFLIQSTQNHDSRVLHLKLDELIRAVQQARTGLVQMEALNDQELDNLKKEFEEIREQAAQSEQSALPENDGYANNSSRTSGQNSGHPQSG